MINKNIFFTVITLLLAGTFFSCSQTSPQRLVFDVAQSEVYVTAQSTGQKLSKAESLVFEPYQHTDANVPVVYLAPDITYQTMLGVGGAITDAAVETCAKLPDDKQEALLRAYYDPEQGIGYNFARLNIAGCDFSSASYSYTEEGDKELKTFNIAHDEKYRIPFVKKAIEYSKKDFYIFASPWSPPAWMKSNNDVLHGGKLLDEFKPSWANHYVKFIEAYNKHGIPIWGLTVQNEPLIAQPWESCVFTAEEEGDFIKNYLGPTLAKSPYKDTKIIAWDHNRDQLFLRAKIIMSDPEAAKYVWGFGFHWYETWTWPGSEPQFNKLQMVKDAYPDKELIFTEGCIFPFDSVKLSDWSLGEHYGYAILNDFNAGTCAWVDWNVLLNENGGPNHVNNNCFAPIHADTRTGELIFTNSYYYIGHFSKFIQPGAKRIATASAQGNIGASGFLNPDGTIVVILLNRTNQELSYKLNIGHKAADVHSLPHSIMTVILKSKIN
jgi:glucosylceramidase